MSGRYLFFSAGDWDLGQSGGVQLRNAWFSGTIYGHLLDPTNNAVVAGTNAQGQGALTATYNVITTAASNPSGVTLPAPTQGRTVTIVNKGANPLKVYPTVGASIDALGANAAIDLPVGGRIVVKASSTTQWYSNFTNNLVLATAVALSGTSVDFTGIPPLARLIKIPYSGLSTNGASMPMIQLGDSGGFEATGYSGTTAQVATTPSVSISPHSTGFHLNGAHAATAVYHGVATLVLLNPATFLWSVSLTSGRSDSATTCGWGGGSKALSGTLDRIRLTMVNGTDVFDAGSANIAYEF